MKKTTYLAVFLSMSVLIFSGCVDTRNGNGPSDAKTELTDLFRNRAVEYSVTYDLNISTGQDTYSQLATYYVKDEKTMIESVAKAGSKKVVSRFYLVENKSIICGMEEGMNWSCIYLGQGNVKKTDSPTNDMTAIEAIIDPAQVVRTPDRIVAGVRIACYDLTPAAVNGSADDAVKANVSLWTYTYCVSKDGVLLYTELAGPDYEMIQRARNYSLAVPDTVFVPPVEPTGLSGANALSLKDKNSLPRNLYIPKTFTDTGDPVCTVNGRPVIRLYSTTWCPHCKWIKDTFDQTAKKYVAQGKIVAYHWEMDTLDNTLTDAVESSIPESESDVYKKYDPDGGVPTFVFGCRYVRIGNGYEGQRDLETEKKEFEDTIDSLLS